MKLKQKLHQVRAASLREDAGHFFPIGAEVLGEIRSPRRRNMFLARLVQITSNGVEEKLFHLNLPGGRRATLPDEMMRA